MISEPVAGMEYRHYKGDLYRVIFVGQLSNTDAEGELVAVYESLNPKGFRSIRVRTLEGPSGWNTLLSDGTARFVPADDQNGRLLPSPDRPFYGASRERMTEPVEPIPMRLHCPECHELHLDVGEYATKPHHTHACQSCGNVWRPAVVSTVGVRFLPGFKNESAESLRDRAVVFVPDDRLTWPPSNEQVQVWPWSDPTARFEAILCVASAEFDWCWLDADSVYHPVGDVAIWAPLGLELDTWDVWEFDPTAYPGPYRPKVQP